MVTDTEAVYSIFTTMKGSIQMADGSKDGVIVLGIMADDTPELNKLFTITLTRVDGGADIDPNHDTAPLTIQ